MTALPVVLIIGASRGLGLALAREWLSRGWTVIATARSAGQAAGLQETAATSDGRLTIEDDRRRGGQGTSGTAFGP
jgi:NAD(P)-dependent dehydrogenase (short-subunit alcohol dehydrogenase family)